MYISHNKLEIQVEHMGHTNRKLEGDNVLFSNQQQIESKIAFFDMLKAKPEYSHPDTKIYFIGHSLGAYMVLRVKIIFMHI